MRTVVEANQLQSLVTHRIVHNLLGLLHSHADVHSAVAVGLYAVPRQCLDIALSESREARKKERLFKFRLVARSASQPHEFGLRQMLLLGGNTVDFLQKTVGILLNLVLAVGGV